MKTIKKTKTETTHEINLNKLLSDQNFCNYFYIGLANVSGFKIILEENIQRWDILEDKIIFYFLDEFSICFSKNRHSFISIKFKNDKIDDYSFCQRLEDDIMCFAIFHEIIVDNTKIQTLYSYFLFFYKTDELQKNSLFKGYFDMSLFLSKYKHDFNPYFGKELKKIYFSLKQFLNDIQPNYTLQKLLKLYILPEICSSPSLTKEIVSSFEKGRQYVFIKRNLMKGDPIPKYEILD